MLGNKDLCSCRGLVAHPLLDRKENQVSVKMWGYDPQKCDGDICIGNCDKCPKAECDVEEAKTICMERCDYEPY